MATRGNSPGGTRKLGWGEGALVWAGQRHAARVRWRLGLQEPPGGWEVTESGRIRPGERT